MYLESSQEYLTTAAFTKGRDQYYVSIANLAVRSAENITPIESEIFETLWQTLDSKELLAYKFIPTKSSNMADPAYYMVSKFVGRDGVHFRIPKQLESNTVASELVQRIQLIVRERS